jgi:predicted nucleic acid-binding protein
LIKLLIDEDGSEHAAELWERADLLVCGQLIYPEARAALASAGQGGRLDPAGYTTAVAGLETSYAAMRIVGVDEALARVAGDLAASHGLRGYDAVHLASALAVDAADVLLATWDMTLANAALATGMLVNERGD